MRKRFKTALITGATSGIGEAFAREISSTTKLLLTGRNKEKLAAAAKAMSSKERTVETMRADLTEESEVLRVAQWANEHEIDLLINNAGVGHLGPFLEHELEQERATISVNVIAVVLLTRSLVPGMIKRSRALGGRAGVIVLSSSAAFSAVPYFATYAATKAFNLSFAEALSEELRDQPVDVLALCPGATRTAFGTRAGFSQSSFPGAADPRTVARDGLRALGRHPVKLSGFVENAALGPLLCSRNALTGLVGRAMRVVNRTMVRPVPQPGESLL